jgi:hypothetical protein
VITIKADDGTRVVFSQIAGLIARRIVCYKQTGDRVQAGERIGLIKFGSRVDVIFGPEWYIEVKPGSRVTGGTSILARRAGEAVITDALKSALPLADPVPALVEPAPALSQAAAGRELEAPVCLI